MTFYIDVVSERYASAICYGLFDSCRDELKQDGYRVISLPEFFDVMINPEICFSEPDFTSFQFAPYREFSKTTAENLRMKNKKIPLIAQNSFFTREGFIFILGINPQIFLINDSPLFAYKKDYREELIIDDLGEAQPLLNLEEKLIFPVRGINPVMRKCIFGENLGIDDALEQWGIDTIRLSLCNNDYINYIGVPFLRHNLFSKIINNEIILKAATDIPDWTRGIKIINQ